MLSNKQIAAEASFLVFEPIVSPVNEWCARWYKPSHQGLVDATPERHGIRWCLAIGHEFLFVGRNGIQSNLVRDGYGLTDRCEDHGNASKCSDTTLPKASWMLAGDRSCSEIPAIVRPKDFGSWGINSIADQGNMIVRTHV